MFRNRLAAALLAVGLVVGVGGAAVAQSVYDTRPGRVPDTAVFVYLPDVGPEGSFCQQVGDGPIGDTQQFVCDNDARRDPSGTVITVRSDGRFGFPEVTP